MKYMPLFFNLDNKSVLIIGAGNLALRRARQFLQANARVKVIAPEIHEEFLSLPGVELVQRCVHIDDITHDYFLVLVATSDGCINDQISDECHKKNIPCNRGDDYAKGSFINGTVIDKDPLTVAIMSSGVPELSRFVKERIESTLRPEYSQLAAILSQLRPKIKASFGSQTREFMARWVSEETFNRMATEGHEKIRKEIEACL